MLRRPRWQALHSALPLLLALGACARAARPLPDAPAAAAGCPAQDAEFGSDAPPRVLALGALPLDAEERRARSGGRARVRVLLDAQGAPVACTARVLDASDARLGAAAQAALLATRFAPATLHGRPAPTWVVVPFEVQ
jgi:TonB family protein